MSGNTILAEYDQVFFAEQIDGSSNSAKIVVPAILDLLPGLRSVVDVGCGVGTWLAEFKRLGVPEVRGYDGGEPPDGYLLLEKEEYKKCDFTNTAIEHNRFDLAISLEVGEHLDERFSPEFVRFICSLSDVVLFSAAIPGQGGIHHVNERWPCYWADIFDRENYQFFDVVRPLIWHDRRVEWWYRQNSFLVVNKACDDLIEQYSQVAQAQCKMLDLVHPDMFLHYRKSVEDLQKKIAFLQLERTNLSHALTETRYWVEEMRNSTSWRMTAGLRYFGDIMKKLTRVV